MCYEAVQWRLQCVYQAWKVLLVATCNRARGVLTAASTCSTGDLQHLGDWNGHLLIAVVLAQSMENNAAYIEIKAHANGITCDHHVIAAVLHVFNRCR